MGLLARPPLHGAADVDEVIGDHALASVFTGLALVAAAGEADNAAARFPMSKKR